MKVTKCTSEKTKTGVFLGAVHGIYFPLEDGSGHVFVGSNGQARIKCAKSAENQIPVHEGESVTLQF